MHRGSADPYIQEVRQNDSLQGSLTSFRAAAIATGFNMYLFDLDAPKPACHYFPPVAEPFHADRTGQASRNITSVSFSMTLGQDALPQA